MNKKLLVIANLEHSSPRIPGLVSYLPDNGWDVTIITPALGENANETLGFPERFLDRIKIIEAPYKGDMLWPIRSLLETLGLKRSKSMTEQIKGKTGITKKKSIVDVMLILFQALFAFPDTERTWLKPALHAAIKAIEAEHFDALLSSSPYPTSHLIASRVRESHSLPWIADFRDLWSENHNYPYPKFRKIIDRIHEKSIMKKADAFLTVDGFCAEKIKEMHAKDSAVIRNGFDLNNLASNTELTKKLSITYTGSIYLGNQSADKPLTALAMLLKKGLVLPEHIELRFYGKAYKAIDDFIQKNGLEAVVKQYGPVSRAESFKRQRESQILLLLNWEDESEDELCPLKFFEYLAAKRPIMATGGFHNTAVQRILSETGAGKYLRTIDEMEATLLGYYNEYMANATVSYSGIPDNISGYSYQGSGEKFAGVLNTLIE